MLLSPNLSEYAIRTPHLRNLNSNTLTIGDITILLKAQSLEEITVDLPAELKLTHVAQYVRDILSSKISQNPQLKEQETNILKYLNQHKDVKERGLQVEPLSKFEKKYFKTLVERVIGGCSSLKGLAPALHQLKCFIAAFYNEKQHATIRIGIIIYALDNYFRGKLEMARLSHNTLRKIIKEYAPLSASRRGRGHPNELSQVRAYIACNYKVATP